MRCVFDRMISFLGPCSSCSSSAILLWLGNRYLSGRRHDDEQVVSVRAVDSNAWRLARHRRDDSAAIKSDLFRSIGVDGYSFRQLNSTAILRRQFSFRIVLLDVDVLRLGDRDARERVA